MDERIIVGGVAGVLLVASFFCGCVWNTIFYIGLIRFSIFMYYSVGFVKQYFLQKQLNLAERYGDASYVLVTGGAGGLGLEYAHQFAKNGFNLVLMDMNEEGLQKAKEKVNAGSANTKIETVVCNLAEMKNIDAYKKIMGNLEEFDISIVINNAGFMD